MGTIPVSVHGTVGTLEKEQDGLHLRHSGPDAPQVTAGRCRALGSSAPATSSGPKAGTAEYAVSVGKGNRSA